MLLKNQTRDQAQRVIAGILAFVLAFGSLGFSLPASAYADDEALGNTTVADDSTGTEEGETSDEPVAVAPTEDPVTEVVTEEVDSLEVLEVEGAAIAPLGNAVAIDPTKVLPNSLDYVAAKYEGVGENSVFDVVSYERLVKSVLLKDGKSVIVLGSPRNATSQAALQYINQVAKAQGIEKVYLFDTHLGGELGFDGSDITDPTVLPALHAFWTTLKTAVTTGAATAQTAKLKYIDSAFTGDDTYLFVFDRNGGSDVPSTIISELLIDDTTDVTGDTDVFKTQVATTLTTGLGGDTETRFNQYNFFSTAFASASPKVDAFYGATYYQTNPAQFKLVSVTAPQLIHILQVQGTKNVLVSGSWCPDSRAAIGYISENATRYPASGPVYVWDWRIDGASSTTTYSASDTAGAAQATAGWLVAKIAQLLTPFDTGYENTIGRNFVDGNPANQLVERANRNFRSPSLYQVTTTNAGEKPSVVKNWVHYTKLYELPFHYSNSNTTDADLPIDYELSSGYLTAAQKALGRAAIGDFFSNTQAYQSRPSTSISTTINRDDSGCGDDNDPLDNVYGETLIPNQGTKDYDVQHYDITIDYYPDETVSDKVILGATTVTAKTNKALDIISLDFKALAVDNSLVTVKVDGTPVSIRSIIRENEDQYDNNKFNIVLNAALAQGTVFEVYIPYSTGILDTFVAASNSPQGFFTRNDDKGIAAIGEPLGSVYWFPNNNTPSDGATYTITLIAPNGYTKVSNGVRTSNATTGTRRATVWNVTQDTAPYQIFAYISNDVTELAGTSNVNWPIASQAVQQVTVSDGEGGTKVIPGLSYVNKSIYDANASRNRDKVDTFFNKLPYYIQELEKIAGPYPGESAGFVFENLGAGDGTTNASWGAIETKDRPFFTSASITSENTFVHEYAHQWYGNAVRIAGWEDLWLNEGFATYVTDLFYENTQGFDSVAKYRNAYDRTTAANPWWTYAPAKIETEGDLFGGASAAYNKGALALATLRVSVGDDDFFSILKGWPVAYKGKAASTADFIAYAEGVAGVDLANWANDWLYGQVRPTAWPTLLAEEPLIKNDAAINDPAVAPWKKTAETTGDYLYDEYKAYGLPADHVFEDITQERLLDILSSEGDYYVVFAGPNRIASRTILAEIDAQAKANGITKIYHFDPYLDGYQLDISDPLTPYKKGNASTDSVYELWTPILAQFGAGTVLDTFNSDDALLVRFNRSSVNRVAVSYTLTKQDAVDGYRASVATTGIAKVFKDGANTVPASVRTEFDLYYRTFNARIPTLGYTGEVVQEADREGFALDQLTFPELFNLYNTPGEHVILYASTWCGNTLAMIESFIDKANESGKTAYVFDTTLGNQWNLNAAGEITSFNNQTWNARNSDSATRNTGYYYGEAVRPLKNFITENQSQGQANEANSVAATGNQLGIRFYPDGDLSGTITNEKPWANNADPKNAIRLQLPFLITYNKDAAEPVTHQWLHKNASNTAYTEYMLAVSDYRTPNEGSSAAQPLNGTWAPEITLGQAALESIRLYDPIFGASTDIRREGIQFDRHAGTQRIHTATLISEAAFADGSSKYAIIAKDSDFPDALAASTLAGVLDAPILLTGTAIDLGVKAELARLGVEKIYVVGGIAAISDTIKDGYGQLVRDGAERVAGDTRVSTAIAIAQKAAALAGPAPVEAFIVRSNDFPDALAASSVAALQHLPILLTGTAALDARVAAYLDATPSITTVHILGGTSAVSTATEQALRARTGLVVDRWWGDGRYDTAEDIANKAVDHFGIVPQALGIATGDNFPDALAGGAAIAHRGGLLLLTPTASLHAKTSGLILKHKATIASVEIYGGTSAVIADVSTAIEALLDSN